MKFLNLREDYKSHKRDFDIAIKKVLNSGQFIGGEEVRKFEEELADYCGSKYAVSLNSGSDALTLSLLSLNIGKGDEVITTPFTFVATAEAIVHVGAKPIFVDIGKDLNMNPELIEKAIGKKTKAIIPVHLFGKLANMKAINKIARKHSLKIIEDAAQAIGTREGKMAGTFGEIGVFSFYPTKNLAAWGDGGAIITDKKRLSERIRSLANHGERNPQAYFHYEIGYNSRLDALQAAILRVKLRRLDKDLRKRRRIARYYCEKLGIRFLENSTYHQFTIRIKNRDKLKFSFPFRIYYPLPLHLQPSFAFLNYKRGDFPEAEKASREVLSLPIANIKKIEQDKIIKELKKYDLRGFD